MPDRSKPLRKSTPRPARRPAEYVDPDYLAWLRTRPCRFPGCPEHTSEAHHLRFDEHGASLGRNIKDDRRAITLCHVHHRELHDLAGAFREMTRERLRAWQDQQLAEQRGQYLAGVGVAA